MTLATAAAAILAPDLVRGGGLDELPEGLAAVCGGAACTQRIIDRAQPRRRPAERHAPGKEAPNSSSGGAAAASSTIALAWARFVLF